MSQTRKGYYPLDYKLHVSQFYENYYLNSYKSDITLVIDGKKIPAHRLIISAESEYFEVLLYGDFMEKNQREIVLQDVSYPAFLLILQYMYSKIIYLGDEDVEVVLEAFELTRRFGFELLEADIEEYLVSIISDENVLKFFPLASLLDANMLLDGVFSYIQNSLREFQTFDFLALESTEAVEILSHKRVEVKEIQVFQLVQKWIEKNPGYEVILHCVDFTRLSPKEIMGVVQPSKLYEDSFLQRELESKGFEIKVVKCKDPDNFQTTDEKFSTAKEFKIDGWVLYGIGIELVEQHLINHIQFKFKSTCTYAIEVSLDRKKWIEVFRYLPTPCRRHQELYFPSTEAKFIRIITDLKKFKCNSFKVFQVPKLPLMKENYICPRGNEDINGKIFGEFNTDYGELNVVWKEFKENELRAPYVTNPTIKLNQPYYVNAIRLRIWDYDSRSQSCKVILKNECEGNKLTLECDVKVGWHHIRFPSRAVSLVKIKGNKDYMNVRIEFVELYFGE